MGALYIIDKHTSIFLINNINIKLLKQTWAYFNKRLITTVADCLSFDWEDCKCTYVRIPTHDSYKKIGVN